MKRGAIVVNPGVSEEEADMGKHVTKNESSDDEENRMPKKRTRAEEDIEISEQMKNCATIPKNNDEIQEPSASPSAAISCTTLQDLPVEVLDYILMKAVVKTVIDEKMAKSSWMNCASRVMRRLRTVWSQWDYRLTTNWFDIVLRRTLDSKQPTTVSVELIAKATCKDCYWGFARLNNLIFCLPREIGKDNDEWLYVFESQDMEHCIRTIPLPSVQNLLGMTACKQSNSLYVWGEGNAVWRLVPDAGGFAVRRWPNHTPPGKYIRPGKLHEIIVEQLSVLDDKKVLALRCMDYMYRGSDYILSIHQPDGSVILNVKLSHRDETLLSNVAMKSNGNFVYLNEVRDEFTIREVDQRGYEVRNFVYDHYCCDEWKNMHLYLDRCDRVIFHDGHNSLVFLDQELHCISEVDVYVHSEEDKHAFVMHTDFDRMTNEMIFMYWNRQFLSWRLII